MKKLPQFGGSARPSRTSASGKSYVSKGATMNSKKGMVAASAGIIAMLLTGCGTSSGTVVHTSTATVTKASSVDCSTATNMVTTVHYAACKPQSLPVTSPQPKLTAQQLVSQLTGHFDGFVIGADLHKTTLRVGSQVTTTGHTEVRGANAFSQKTLTSPKAVGAFLKTDAITRTRVVNALKAAGYGQTEINRALTGDGYFAVQETIPSQIYGTTYKNGKTSVVETGARTVPANDIQWLYATTDGKIIYGAAVRADCGNPNLIKVVPVTPSTPPAPPVSCMNTSVAGCQPPVVTPPVVCTINCTPVVHHTCPCVTPAQASQPVIDHNSPVPQYTHPPQVAGATVATQRPAPHQSSSPGVVPTPQSTGNGYSNGGTGSAPGGAQCSDPNNCQSTSTPQPSGPAASPYPTPTAPVTGDPGMP